MTALAIAILTAELVFWILALLVFRWMIEYKKSKYSYVVFWVYVLILAIVLGAGDISAFLMHCDPYLWKWFEYIEWYHWAIWFLPQAIAALVITNGPYDEPWIWF